MRSTRSPACVPLPQSVGVCDTAPQLDAFLPALTPTDIHWVCATVAERVCNLLRHRGLLRDRADDNDDAVRGG
ncbi:MAG: hypothetical protein MUF54_23430 [Polyangiaceae bacterium]|nr:hypothetical protein [Polyangiaceae bacterium]